MKTNNSSIKTTKKVETIEQKAEQNDSKEQKPFLTKKRLILTIVFLIISIGFVFITIFPILKVDWNSYNQSIGIGLSQNWGFLWLFLIIVNAFINLNRCFITIMPRIRKFGCKIPYKDYLVYALTVTFLGCVSPANLVSDPYTMFWLKTYGVTTSKVTSMMFTNSLIWQVSQILITTPVFIICCVNLSPLIASSEGIAVFTFICVGVALDYVCLIFLLLMNWSKNFHYWCSCVFNWFKKKFHLKYHTKDQIKEKYKEKAVLKQDFIDSMRDWKTSLWILFLFTATDILGLLAMIWAMSFVQYGIIGSTSRAIAFAKVEFDWGWVLVCARLSIPANRINILPGGAMGYEAVLLKLLSVYSDLKVPVYVPLQQVETIKKNLVTNAVLTGKLFYAWIPALIGIAGFISLTIKQSKLAKEGKLIQQKY